MMPTNAPLLSVIVPAHRASHFLGDTLTALRGSTLDAARWELIVVDDGSGDATANVARQFADTVLGWPAPAQGPGAARNAGARAARGTWLLFVDADVRVHSDTLHHFVESVAAHPEATAIFGTYDARPAGRQLLSQYRNLLHRYVHVQGAGAAETFWAGLGGARRDRFLAIGGFDATAYPRPSIEDIELGYRLREAGYEIVLDSRIEATHLKCWTFGTMARTDFTHRALPWMRLLLERRGRIRSSLNIGQIERARVALAGIALVATPLGLVAGVPYAVWFSLACLAVVLLGSLPLVVWLGSAAGPRLAAVAIPLQGWYYLSNAVAAGLGLALHGLQSFRSLQHPQL
jgi:glycosyltransferase involved in cell wall biosynthesis